MKYIIDRMELNTEQRYWFCWIYANTYQLPTAWVIFNEFPDYENVPQDRIARFSDECRHRLPYQKDQKWLRGCLGETFASYQEVLEENANTQESFWHSLCGDSSATVNFTICWDVILSRFFKFGRYTAWFYLQALKEVCGLRIEPSSLMLGFDSSAAHRAGLCLALGLDEKAVKGYKFSKDELQELECLAAPIVNRVRNLPLPELPVAPDYFSMETSLCAFKKLFRRSQGRYLGYYLDRFAEDITKTSLCDWPGINWQLFWDARDEILLPELNCRNVNQQYYNLFLDNGTFHPNAELTAKLDQYLG